VAGVVLTGRGEFEALQARTHAMQFKRACAPSQVLT
jgi:hypothetical protein